MKNDMDERAEAPPEEHSIDEKPAGAEQAPQKTKRKLGGKTVALIVCGALVAFFGLVTLILRDPFTLVLTVLLAIPVITLAIVIARDKYVKRHPKYSFLPYWGIIAEAICVPLALLGGASLLLPAMQMFGLIMVLAAVACPVFGITAGIATLAQGRKNCSTGGFVTAIIDIIIPPLAVAIVILLFSLDVIVITLM